MTLLAALPTFVLLIAAFFMFVSLVPFFILVVILSQESPQEPLLCLVFRLTYIFVTFNTHSTSLIQHRMT